MVGTLTTNVLGILGIEPAFGRGFAPQGHLEGDERVVLLDQGLWRNRFGGRTEVLGTRLELDGEPHTVIGVMCGDFTFPYGEVKLWVPLSLDSPSASWTFENFQPVGRLAAGVDRAALREEMQTLYQRRRVNGPAQCPTTGLPRCHCDEPYSSSTT